MITQGMIQQQISAVGVEIVGKEMSITEMIRFLQQDETGYKDYTKDKNKFRGDPSLKQLFADIQSSGLNKKTLPV